MNYTFLGNKDFVTKEINDLIKDYNDEEIGYYNLEEDSIDRVLEDISTVSLFGKKIVVVYNLDKLKDDKDLINYLNSDTDDNNILVLSSYKELDKRKKIVKTLKEKTKLKELFSLDMVTYIKNNLKDYKMDFMTINLLISYTSSNIFRIDNELEKLKIYKDFDKIITSDDVKKIVKKSYDSTIFDLIDNINRKDIDKIFKIYEELQKEGETSDRIMYTIANHYRLLFQIKNLIGEKSDKEIQSMYLMHPYRLTKLKEQANVMDNSDILFLLQSLGNIDIKVKSGKGKLDSLLILFFRSLT